MKKLTLSQIFDRAEKVSLEKVKYYSENKTLKGVTYLGKDIDNLRKFPLKVTLHNNFCNPQEIIDEIETYSKNKTVMNYYQGNKYVADVIISEYKINVKQMIGDTIIYAELEVTLLESIMPPELPENSFLDNSLETFLESSNKVQNYLSKAKEESIWNTFNLDYYLDNISYLPQNAKQSLEFIKSSVIRDVTNQGLYYASDIISGYMEDIENNKSLTLFEKELIKSVVKEIPKLITLKAERYDDLVEQRKKIIEELKHQWIWPYKGTILDSFKIRDVHPVTGKTNTPHNGIDIDAKFKEVKAIADGIVIFADVSGSLTSGYGRLIKISHGTINGKTYVSYYAHLSEFKVKKGEKVKQGKVIAISGNSGGVTGPHLHFEIRVNGKPENPLKYLK